MILTVITCSKIFHDWTLISCEESGPVWLASELCNKFPFSGHSLLKLGNLIRICHSHPPKINDNILILVYMIPTY